MSYEKKRSVTHQLAIDLHVVIQTYFEAGFSNFKFYFCKGGDVFGLNQLVPVHPTGLVKPESDQINGRLEALGRREQHSLNYNSPVYTHALAITTEWLITMYTNFKLYTWNMFERSLRLKM